MSKSIEDAQNKSIIETHAGDCSVSSQSLYIACNQGLESRSSVLGTLATFKHPEMSTLLATHLVDTSAIQRISDDCRDLQLKIAESMRPFIETQENIRRTLDKMYEPMRRLAEITNSINESISTSLAPFKKPLRLMQVARRNQTVIWYDLNPKEDVEFLNSSYLDEIVLEHFLSNDSLELNLIIQKCRTSLQKRLGCIIFEQSIDALDRKAYHAAILCLTSALDGVLTLCSGSDSTSARDRLSLLQTKLLKQDDDSFTAEEINEFWLYSTLFPAIESFNAKAPFEQLEPNLLNRHWIAHGRTTREYTLIDCIKVLSMIYGMLSLGDYVKATE